MKQLATKYQAPIKRARHWSQFHSGQMDYSNVTWCTGGQNTFPHELRLWEKWPLVHMCSVHTCEYKTQPHHSCFLPGSFLGSTLVCTSPLAWSSSCHGNHSAFVRTAMSWHWRQSRWDLQRSAWSPLVGHTRSHQALASLLQEDGQEVALLMSQWAHLQANSAFISR